MADAKKMLGTELRRELIALLDGGQAHATFEDAVKDFPAKLRGVVPEGLPYSAWQIVEHLRLAQRDILEFSDNSDGSYKHIKWPDDYWPKSVEPADAGAWEKSLAAIRADRKAFDKLVHAADDAELVKAFEWGRGADAAARGVVDCGPQCISHGGVDCGAAVIGGLEVAVASSV